MNWDDGFYFDTRDGAPPLYHIRALCDVGQLIPESDRRHTYNVGDLNGLKECEECDILDLFELAALAQRVAETLSRSGDLTEDDWARVKLDSERVSRQAARAIRHLHDDAV
jgi:hypothetical protein